MKVLFAVFIAMTSSFAQAAPADLKACLKEALDKPNPLYQVPETKEADGYSRYLVLICRGSTAKDLYDSLAGVASDGDWNGKTRGETKFLAEDGGASMCYHITRDADGEAANEYSCSIRLNIDSKLIGPGTSGEMSSFPVK